MEPTVEKIEANFAEKYKVLQKNQDFADYANLKQSLGKISVRSAKAHEFFRAHPDTEFGYIPTVFLIADSDAGKDESKFYFVDFDMDLWNALGDLGNPFSLTLAVNRNGNTFIIPVRVAVEGEEDNMNWITHREVLEAARTKWVKRDHDHGRGHLSTPAPGDLGEPKWMRETIFDLIPHAFKGRIISSVEHKLVQKLRGLE
jgi:hypothetical protein